MTLRMFEITCPSPVKQRSGIGGGLSSGRAALDADAAATATCNAPTGTRLSGAKTDFASAFGDPFGTFDSFAGATVLFPRFMAKMLLAMQRWHGGRVDRPC
jgi:hypothetical protein